MKLSEAILMNGMVKPQGFGSDSIGSLEAPCALGGALQSVGQQAPSASSLRNMSLVGDFWPWARKLQSHPLTGERMPSHSVIWRLNDEFLWTRAQIAAWVASVEPQEEQADGGQGPVEVSLEVTAS